MKKFIILFLFLTSNAIASDWNIDIENGPLGVKWNASEKEVIEVLGQPNGHFNISKHRKILFYGKTITLFLSRGKLKEVMYAEHESYALMNTPVSYNADFDKAEITISNQKVIGENFDNVAKALKVDLGAPDHQVELATDSADIYLSFSSSVWDGKKNYQLTRYRIKYQL